MSAAPTVLLVPGFMQHGRAWEEVAGRLPERYRRRFVDLRATDWSGRVEELLDEAPPGALAVGYSLGGRLVLHAALRNPERFAGIVTIGASGGIEDEAAREKRRRADEALADWIEAQPIEAVVERWEALAVFATQSEELVRTQRADRRDHDPHALARLLRTGGQGALAPVWGRLAEIEGPLLALAGELDAPYVAAAHRMAAAVPAGEAGIVPAAGHAAHLEQPAAAATLLEGFAARVFG